jgi:hypothetical protein
VLQRILNLNGAPRQEEKGPRMRRKGGKGRRHCELLQEATQFIVSRFGTGLLHHTLPGVPRNDGRKRLGGEQSKEKGRDLRRGPEF